MEHTTPAVAVVCGMMEAIFRPAVSPASLEAGQITDAEMVTQALAGSQQAYRRLIERYQRPVLSVIVRMVRDPALAEDLAQDTFVKAFRNLHRFDLERKLASWLFKIAHNTTLDYLRRKRPEEVSLTAGSSDGENEWEVLESPEEQSPERVVGRSELARDLERALGTLPAKYREILVLRFREGLSYQEIADVTGQAMGTVKIQLHRARKRLATELGELGWTPPGKWSG